MELRRRKEPNKTSATADTNIRPSTSNEPLSPKRHKQHASFIFIPLLILFIVSAAALYWLYQQRLVGSIQKQFYVGRHEETNYGTSEFQQLCSWMPPPAVTTPHISSNKCNLRLVPTHSEGISRWMADIVMAYLAALHKNCTLWLEYPGVNLNQFFNLRTGMVRWVNDDAFECSSENKCEAVTRMTLQGYPDYRMAYNQHFYSYIEANKMPKGYQADVGMMCILSGLLEPIVLMDESVAKLRSQLLNRDSYVIGLYIRSYHADDLAREEDNGATPAYYQQLKRDPMESVKCALHVEQEYKKRHHADNNEKNVVWLLITDSPKLQHSIPKKYATKDRTILTTGARGIHTKSARNVTTDDFREALVDWYMLGEADVAIVSGVSFGVTAAARTRRPVYYADKCQQQGQFDVVGNNKASPLSYGGQW